MNSKKSWRIIIGNTAEKNLKHIIQKDFDRIEKAIDQMAVDPFIGDINKLSGKGNNWRRRVGNYRIIFEVSVEKKIIYIYEIKRRTSKSY